MTEDAPKDTGRPATAAGSFSSTGKTAHFGTHAPMSGDLYQWEWRPIDKLTMGDVISVLTRELTVMLAAPLAGDFWTLYAATDGGDYVNITVDRNIDILTRLDS